MTPQQRVQTFAVKLPGGDGRWPTFEQHVLRVALHQPIPGDFVAVQRQMDILGDRFQPKACLSQLEHEHRVKPRLRQRRGNGLQRTKQARAMAQGGGRVGR